jgi:hypothetical protein
VDFDNTTAATAIPPVLDVSVLNQLERQLDDPTPAKAFARDYVSMWRLRYKRLTESLEAEDRDAALDVVLSLKNTSKMVGAARLTALTNLVQAAVAAGDLPRARQFLPRIKQCGHETVKELCSTYLADSGGSTGGVPSMASKIVHGHYWT